MHFINVSCKLYNEAKETYTSCGWLWFGFTSKGRTIGMFTYSRTYFSYLRSTWMRGTDMSYRGPQLISALGYPLYIDRTAWKSLLICFLYLFCITIKRLQHPSIGYHGGMGGQDRWWWGSEWDEIAYAQG